MDGHDVVLPGVLEDAIRRHIKKRLPLKFDGFEIGTAYVKPNGDFVVTLNSTEVSNEVRERIFGDTTRSLSIAPRITP